MAREILCMASVMGSESLHPWLGYGARGSVRGLEKALQDSRERRESGQDAAQLCWRQVPSVHAVGLLLAAVSVSSTVDL